MNNTTEQTSRDQIEEAVQAYVDDEREVLENHIRHAFLAGYSAGLAAASEIYKTK